ncbi:YkgJ family cysteine cluster protein [Halococcus sediminicola]|uniref:YkgJ family cysteine cluster protein n=1 Tax=Halococcus sediminicola TaxID=1264579 RepID=UPI0006799111|nr:YkgJ family cysteine cluster protein [Halococcus sediminicola]
MSFEDELARARDLDTGELADAIEAIGFECTRCGACCKAAEGAEGTEEHTATVFPDEVRELQAGSEYDWRDVARPMPYGLSEGEDGVEGETFEWALETDGCGDCTFYAEEDGTGACTVHEDRPLICRTYPFSVALDGSSQPMGAAVDRVGDVRAHECEGLGRDIDREHAEELAGALKERAIRELEEAIAVGERYEPANFEAGEVVVHDSEGAKRPDGTPIDE